LGLFLVILAASIVGAIVEVLVQMFYVVQELKPGDIFSLLGYWVGWSVTAAFSFICPFLLAVAIHLYLVDQKILRQKPLGWQSSATVAIITFFGCLGLAMLPIVVVQTLRASASGEMLGLATAVALATPPAVVNAAFVFRSGQRLGNPSSSNALVDFLVFGLFGAIAAVVVGSFLTLLFLREAPDLSGYVPLFVSTQIPQILAVAAVSGLFGASECAMSRRAENAALTCVQARSALQLSV
jgi:hypothetical protein